MVATVLEIREKSGNSRKKRKVREKSVNFDRLSEPESSFPPQVQLVDLSFFQNAISRSQGKFSEVREKSGKTKVEKVATLLEIDDITYVEFALYFNNTLNLLKLFTNKPGNFWLTILTTLLIHVSDIIL